LMVVSLGFIARRFVVAGVDFSWLTSPWVVVGLFAVAFTEGLAMIVTSLNFRGLLKNISGVLVAKPLAMTVYLVSNLYKYIPGGVMYVAGRHRMVVETEDLTHGKLAFSTVVEGALIAIGALLIALTFSFEFAVEHMRQSDILSIVLIVIMVLLVAATVPLYIFRKRVFTAVKKFWATVELFKPLVLIKRFVFAVVLMFLWSFTFLLTIMLLGQPVTMEIALPIMGLYLLSWLSGFLAPGAPSGIGVREFVMLTFLGGLVNESILLAAMVIHRIVTMTGDVSAYGLALAYEKYAKREPQHGEQLQ